MVPNDGFVNCTIAQTIKPTEAGTIGTLGTIASPEGDLDAMGEIG